MSAGVKEGMGQEGGECSYKRAAEGSCGDRNVPHLDCMDVKILVFIKYNVTILKSG